MNAVPATAAKRTPQQPQMRVARPSPTDSKTTQVVMTAVIGFVSLIILVISVALLTRNSIPARYSKEVEATLTRVQCEDVPTRANSLTYKRQCTLAYTYVYGGVTYNATAVVAKAADVEYAVDKKLLLRVNPSDPSDSVVKPTRQADMSSGSRVLGWLLFILTLGIVIGSIVHLVLLLRVDAA